MSRLIRPTTFDRLIAGGLVLGGEIEVWLTHTYTGPRALTSALVLIRGLALLWRRDRPLAVLGVELAAIAPVLLYDSAPVRHDSASEVLPGIIAIYSAGAYAVARERLMAGLMVFAGALFRAYLDAGANAGQILASLAFFGAIYGGTWLAGLVVGRHRARTSRAEERAGRAEAEREQRARTAVAEERARIARELHDIVAHAISVIVLQAKGGRRMLDAEPAETRQALDAIVDSGEQALVEMRRLLGMLRRSDEEIAMAPLPSLRHLDLLAGQVSAAGLPVEMRIEGKPSALPAGIDLSAYRIVQEALTNALKHAGPARARVVVRYASDAVELEIADDGRGASAAALGDGGFGLAGMQERAAVFGGQIEGRPQPGGGFAVRATLPLDREP